MRKLPTGEPCAGEPHARFGGRGRRKPFPTPIKGCSDLSACDAQAGGMSYLLARGSTQEDARRAAQLLRAQYGLDQPESVQFFNWIKGIVTETMFEYLKVPSISTIFNL